MSFSDSRRTAGIYDDPNLRALALEAATSGRPTSAFDLFGLAPTVPQQPAIPPVLLQLIAQMARDKVEAEPLPDPRGNIPGTNIPNRGMPEGAYEKFRKVDYGVDPNIHIKLPDANLDPEMELDSIPQHPTRARTWPKWLWM